MHNDSVPSDTLQLRDIAVDGAFADLQPFRQARGGRKPTPAQQLDDLEQAVGRADIIVTGTMSTTPVIQGNWLRPGQHLNMIGAYRPDMREADDTALLRSRIFVDSIDTTLGHIGELKIPHEAGIITPDHILADYYNLSAFAAGPDDITLFKNGGGAHLDLMTSLYILNSYDH